MSLFNLFRKPKDAALAALVKPILQPKLQPYGTMTSLNINSAEKSIHVSLDLKGEDSPLDISLLDYQIVKDGGDTIFRIGSIETSREWINQLIQSYLPENKKSIPLPPKAAGIVSALL